MTPKKRTWMDDKDGLFRTEITITYSDGTSDSFEGKGKTVRESRESAQLIYDQYREAEGSDGKSAELNESPASITKQLCRPGITELANGKTEANIKPPILGSQRNPQNVPSAPRKALVPLIPRSQPLQKLQRFKKTAPAYSQSHLEINPKSLPSTVAVHTHHVPPHRDIRRPSYQARMHPRPSQAPLPPKFGMSQNNIPTSSSYGNPMDSVLPRPAYFSRTDFHDVPSLYRNSDSVPVPHLPRPLRAVRNGINSDHGPARYPSNERTKSWSEDAGGSRHTGSRGRRSKRIKTKNRVRENPSYGSAPKLRKERSPESEEDEALPVEVDDTGEDYVSKLNELKNTMSYRFMNLHHSIKNRPPSTKQKKGNNGDTWICTMSMVDVRETERNDGKEVFVTVKKKCLIKKESKRLAAKYLIQKLNTLKSEDVANGVDLVKVKNPGLQSDDDISILHQWWQKKLIKCKPEIEAKQMDKKAEGIGNGASKQVVWKATYFGRVEGVADEIVTQGVDTVKIMAKKIAARDAVKRIRELKLPGFEEALVSKKESAKMTARRHESCPGNTDEMVQLSDDENNCSTEVAINPVFALTSNYRVVIAKTVGECDEWVSNLLESLVDVGVYVDSVFQRREMLMLAKEVRYYDGDKHDKDTIDCRVVCLATDSSALLLYMDFFKAGHGKLEMPKSVRDVLENEDIEKLGMWGDAANAALRVNFGVCTSPIFDLGVNSFALKSVLLNGSLHTASTIVGVWLKLSFQPFSQTAINSVHGLREIVDSTDALIAPAVLTALVGPRVKKLFKQAAAAQDERNCAAITGFHYAAEKLTSPIVRNRKRRVNEAFGS